MTDSITNVNTTLDNNTTKNPLYLVGCPELMLCSNYQQVITCEKNDYVEFTKDDLVGGLKYKRKTPNYMEYETKMASIVRLYRKDVVPFQRGKYYILESEVQDEFEESTEFKPVIIPERTRKRKVDYSAYYK